MNAKSDWQAVHEEMTAEDRRKLGEPPTTEEMLAYKRGELHLEDAERVRALLVCHPDLARALMQPFPISDAKPGDHDFLSEEEVSKRWGSLRKRIHTERRVLQFRTSWMALAAALVVVFAGLFWQAQTKAQRLARELAQPRGWETQMLLPDGQRGGGEQSTVLTAKGEGVVLVIPLFNASRFAGFRVEMIDEIADPPRTPWRSSVIRAGNDETISILVPRAYLKPGKYRIVVFGIDGAREERLDSYTLRVPLTPQ